MATIEQALNHGWKIHQSGDFRGAEEVYRQVLLLDGANANAWCFLGMSCHDQSRYEDAVAAYRQALQFKPQFPVALSNLGNTYKAMGRLEDAVASCQEALRQKPDYHTAYNNLGVALVSQGKLGEASSCFEAAIKFAPHDAVAHTNLSAALVRQGKYLEANQNSERALQLNPAYAEAHKNQAIVWLLLGDFARGWDEYEWRWRCPGASMPFSSQPPWDGSSLAGKTILLHAEQGLGDSIQFIRYAALLRQTGARVIIQIQKGLVPLLQSFRGADEIIEPSPAIPQFDAHAPLMSLPRIMKTRLETIPADVPYLAADPKLVDHWRGELDSLKGFKIGIAWQGSLSNQGDKQRSTTLAEFAPLAEVPGVRLINLQKGAGCEQIAAERGRINVVDFGDRLDANGPFMDTAAIMANLDLVITVDTAIAHLAGALGLPVWIALAYSPDWRWMVQRTDSPWYPTARLFRQPKLGDWPGVFQQVAHELVTRRLPDHAARRNIANLGAAADSHADDSRVLSVTVPISPGELVDKITILEIKNERIDEIAKLANVRRELEELLDVYRATIPGSSELRELTNQLKTANEALWTTEDEIRDCERRDDFGETFIRLARSVYRQNDRRAALKRQINDLLGAAVVEEKSYASY